MRYKTKRCLEGAFLLLFMALGVVWGVWFLTVVVRVPEAQAQVSIAVAPDSLGGGWWYFERQTSEDDMIRSIIAFQNSHGFVAPTLQIPKLRRAAGVFGGEATEGYYLYFFDDDAS